MGERTLQNKGTKKAILPAPSRSQVLMDFDGTISKQDVLDRLIQRYSIDNSWKIVEEQWSAGLIGSRKCLETQFSLLRISAAELADELDSIELDEGIFQLLEILRTSEIPVIIVSDCVDFFIKRILKRHGIENILIRSNTAVHKAAHIELKCPHYNPQCLSQAAQCKCSSLRSFPDRKSIYIGDGISDLCVAKKADFVFAKNVLASRLEQESVDFVRYSNLNDIAIFLSNVWVQAAATRKQ